MWPVDHFYDGSNWLAEDEVHFSAIFERRGRGDLGEMVRRGRRWQRYLFFLGGGIPRDMAEFKPLFQGLRESFVGEEGEAAILSYEDWKHGALGGFARRDTQLQALMRDERAKERKATD